MNGASELVRTGREAAGLSLRALAERAGIPASTVSRIESGKVDPTCRMLVRILEASGFEVDLRIRPRRRGVLADLWDAYRPVPGGIEPDWTRIRAFLDAIEREPGRIGEAITAEPPPQTPRLIAALLAGIAEKLADGAHSDRPDWTASAPRLSEGEWPVPGTPRMQAAIRRATPDQLLRRGVIVDEGTLWRQRTASDA